MTNYVQHRLVRIAHTARVRLGAYIGEGTTIMHEGFVNFNAGTEGPGMIEGRISAGVFVGKGLDPGGGCSTMGTLSGGGDIVISVGDERLLGANAGTGIPLGDRRAIESALHHRRHQGCGTRRYRRGGKSESPRPVWQIRPVVPSQFISGAVECKTNKTAIALNEELHANNYCQAASYLAQERGQTCKV